jgi:hypothetical protein
VPAHKKLQDDQWASVRKRWESDTREGYAWLITEMSLPVSAPAVRKKALRQSWRKDPRLQKTKALPSATTKRLLQALDAAERKIRSLRKTLEQRNHA